MGRTFALSDIHGQRGLWEQIKKFLQPEDHLYFLGDAIDRGPDGFNIMKEMMKNSQITYIKGNHELLMEDALREMKHEDHAYEALTLWFGNGGRSTYNAWKNSGSHFLWIRQLSKLSHDAIYINEQGQTVHLCHAGFTPGSYPKEKDEILWDRLHYYDHIPEEEDIIVVHGHTPNEYILEDFNSVNEFYHKHLYSYRMQDGAIFYADNKKVDIDCGCFFTGNTVLLDLDTWETVPFFSKIEI